MTFPPVDWARYAPALLWLHVLVGGAWLGTILCVRSLCARARWMADPEETGRLAAAVFARWAWLWLVASLLAGVARGLALGASALHDRALLAEMAVGTVVLVTHFVVWRRAAHVAAGERVRFSATDAHAE